MSPSRRLIGRVLAMALVAPVVAMTAQPATAASGLSGLVIDSVWTDGTGLTQSSSHLSPDYTLTALPWSTGWKFQPLVSATGSQAVPYVLVQPTLGGTLTAGQTYPLASSQDATHATVQVYNGYYPSGCTVAGGSLSVAEAVPNAAGTSFDQLALTFHEQCGSSPAEVYGEVRVGSSTDVTSSFVSPRGFVFSPVPAGTGTPVKTFTLQPNGSTPVTLGQAAVGGPDAGDFALGSDTCSGATLAVGASCSFTVTATPEAGARSATVTIPDGSARGFRLVTLQATGQVPPTAPQGLTTRTASDGVAVAWQPPLSWGGATPSSYQVLRGTSPDALSVVATLATSGVGGRYADRVGADTQVATTYYYAVRATNSVGTSDASATVSGATPAAVVVPSSRRVLTVEGDASGYVAREQGYLWASTADNPNNVSTGGCGYQLCVTGNQAGLPYASISLSPPTGTLLSPGTYALAGNVDASHAGGVIGVGGQGTQTWSGTLTVSRADIDASGVLVAFSGEIAMPGLRLSIRLGTDDPVTFVSVSPVDAGSGTVGTTTTASSTVTNVGDTTVTVAGATTAPLPNSTDDWTVGSPDTCTGTSLAPGASCTIGVAVTPTAAGSRGADLVVTDDTPMGTHDRALTINALGTPDQPQALTAVRAADGKVTLSWFDYGSASKAPASFVVSTGSSPDALTVLGTVPATGYGTYSLTDPSTADSTRYYEVHGTNAAGDGPSATLTVDAHHYAPTGLRVSAVVGRATLTWSAPTGYPAGPVTYDVYKGPTAATMTKALSTTSTSTTFTGLVPGSVSYLAVVARTALASSPRSSVVSFTAPHSQLVLANADGYGSYWLTRAPTGPSSEAVALPRPDWAVGMDAYEAEVSPNGTTVAFTVGPAERIFTQLTDGTGFVLQVSDGGHQDDEPSWSPDGTRLSFTRWSADQSSSSLMTVASSGGTASAVPSSTHLSASSWTGPRTLVAEDDSSATASLVLIDTVTGARRVLPNTAGGYSPVARPDGTEVAFLLPGTGDADQLYVVNVATGVRRTIPVPTNAGLGRPSWSRDQATLYIPAFTYALGSEVWSAAATGSSAAVPLTSNNGYVDSVSVSTPDTTAPTVAVPALPALTLTGSVKVAYSASDALNGIRRYDVRYTRQTATASYAAVLATGAGTTSTSVVVKLAAGSTYCFSVRAADRAGNTSAWSTARCTTAPLDDRSLSRVSFTAVTGSAYYLGTAATTTTYHATLVTSLTAQPLYLVATTCPTCGTLEVRKGTTLVAVISLVSSTTVYRHVLAVPYKAATGGVSLRVSSSGKRVTVDGLVLKHV